MTVQLKGWVNSVCWSPTDKFCFAAAHDATITVINNYDNKRDTIYLTHSPATAIVPISDVAFYAVCYDRHIYKYEFDTQKNIW